VWLRREYFRAVLYPHALTSLPMLYDVVRCSRDDAATRRNLWDCEQVEPAVEGRCDPVTNAAGVTCEPLPVALPSNSSQSVSLSVCLSVCLSHQHVGMMITMLLMCHIAVTSWTTSVLLSSDAACLLHSDHLLMF